MKRTIDERSGGATAWIRPVDACQDLLRYAALLLRSVFWTPLALARTAFDRAAAHSSRLVRTTFADAAADHIGLPAFLRRRTFAVCLATPADAACTGPATVHSVDTAAASHPDGRKRGRTADGGGASKPQIERERGCGMDSYGRWGEGGTRPRCSGMRSRPPATDHGPDRFVSQTAALAR